MTQHPKELQRRSISGSGGVMAVNVRGSSRDPRDVPRYAHQMEGLQFHCSLHFGFCNDVPFRSITNKRTRKMRRPRKLAYKYCLLVVISLRISCVTVLKSKL